MKADDTIDASEATLRPVSAGRKGRSTRRRGSATSRPKEDAVQPATPARSQPSVKKARKTCPRMPKAKSPPVPPSESPEPSVLHVPLPGTLRPQGHNGDRGWWWEVKLPGEEQAKLRPLKPKNAEAPTEDLDTARSLALEMWQQAYAATVERRIKSETSQTIAKLKAQFLEKVRDFSQVVETTKARLEAETQARAEAEAKVRALAARPVETTACECCGGAGIVTADVTRIDSGQLLCPACLAALRAEVERIESKTQAVSP